MGRHKRRSILWHVGQGIGYVALRWAMVWIQIMGWRRAQEFGRWLGCALHAVLGRRRRLAAANMRAAKIVGDEAQARWLTRRMFQHLGMFAAEFGLLELTRRRRQTRARVTLECQERMREALARGKGAMLSIGHLGNWELAGQGFCEEIQALHSVYRPLDYPPIDRLVLRIRRACGMEMISNDQAIPRIARVFKRNGVVALLTDQDARSEGIFVEFFGRPASTLPTPARLSLRFGAPIVPVNVFRIGSRHVARFDPPIYPEAFEKAADPVQAMTQEIQRRLEAFVREHPAQWFWLHRRWKTQPQ